MECLNAQCVKELTGLETTSGKQLHIDEICTEFWSRLLSMWSSIHEKIIQGKPEGLTVINNLLYIYVVENNKTLGEFIEIDATYGELNRQTLPDCQDYVELYISPKGNKNNLKYMESLYKTRVALANGAVFKYKPYHKADRAIKTIEYPDGNKTFEVSYDDIGYQGSFGYDGESKKPLLNMVLIVKQSIADKILEKRNVKFIEPSGKTSSRDVYLQAKYPAIDIFLSNLFGEYHLLNHVGYIEILPSEHPLVREPSEENVFTELADGKASIDIVVKSYQYKSCHYCTRHELQSEIYACGKCHSATYCTRKCQKAHWGKHKKLCIKSSSN